MKAVWKYPIAANSGNLKIEMPKGAVIIHVAAFGERANFWVEVDPTAEYEIRVFRVFATGELFDSSVYRYIGTFTMYDGALVWHLYERVET